MERIYRDDRFPDLEIRNSGGSIFNIWILGDMKGYHRENGWVNTDCFTHYPKAENTYAVPADEAENAASGHFDYMAEQQQGESA